MKNLRPYEIIGFIFLVILAFVCYYYQETACPNSAVYVKCHNLLGEDGEF